MPELNPTTTRWFKGRGPKAFANARAFGAVVRGRPRKGETSAGSKARSLRLPDAAWAELERRSDELGTSVHSLLRQLVGEFLYTETPRRAEPVRPRVVKVQSGRVRKSAKR